MAIVYRHIRKDNNEVFYIGIGVSKRRAFEKVKRSDFWKQITNKTDYIVDILFEDISYEEAKAKEIELIKFYGRRDLGLGPLVNMTDGGEGMIGIKFSDETKKKMSKSREGEKNHFFGKTHSDETKLKISSKKRGIIHSDETKKKMSEGSIGQIHSDETKEKIRESRLNSTNGNKKLVLNIETGIYYSSIKEAAKTSIYSEVTLGNKLKNKTKNNTQFILCGVYD